MKIPPIKVLIVGEAGHGKTTSLRHIVNQANTLYIPAEGKGIMFRKHNFIVPENLPISPREVFELCKLVENDPEIKTIIIDGLNGMMDIYRRTVVDTAADTRNAWAGYGNLIQGLLDVIKMSKKNYIVLAHTFYDTSSGKTVSAVPIQGATQKKGIEADFDIIVQCRSASMVELESVKDFDTNLLRITDKERMLQSKYVFQVQKTADNPSARIRSLEDMWADNQVFMDNNVQMLFEHIAEYYTE